ncbi:MAG: hypothetical protein ABW048_12685 [Sphingobium sp.]
MIDIRLPLTRTLIFVSCIITLSACTSGPALREGPARLGERAMVGGPIVEPVKIVEDSRCPQNARCIWAGRLVVRTLVTGGTWSRSMDLTLGEPAAVADGTVTLVSATPETSTRRPIVPRDYRFVFRFDGGL